MLRFTRPIRHKALLPALALAIVFGLWWAQPASDIMIGPHRFSEWETGLFYPLEPGEFRAAATPKTVKWLAYTVEHGERPFYRTTHPLPFDRAPAWVRKWIPDRLGGFRESGTWDKRAAAAEILHGMARAGAPEAARAIPALGRYLNAPYSHLDDAAGALANIGSAAWPAIQQALAHPEPGVRIAMLNAFTERVSNEDDEGASPPSDAELQHLADALGHACYDSDSHVRAAAAGVIEAWLTAGTVATDKLDVTMPALVTLLSDSSTGLEDSFSYGEVHKTVQNCAAEALGNFKNRAAPAIPKLLELLESGDERTIDSVAHVLQSIGSPSWPEVERILTQGKPALRDALLAALPARFKPVQFKPQTGTHLVTDRELARIYEILIADLHDPEPRVRALAATALGECHRAWISGSLFEEAIPALLAIFAQPNAHTIEIDPTTIHPINRSVYLAVAEALQAFDTDAASAIPQLIALLDSADWQVRFCAAMVLEKVDATEQRSANHLRAMLQDPDADCRNVAESALKAFSEHDAKAHQDSTSAGDR